MKHMLSVEAVWVMPSKRSFHTLSTPIREPLPNIFDGRTTLYTFAASFSGAQPEKNRSTLQKKLPIVYHKSSAPWQASRRLGFEKKN